MREKNCFCRLFSAWKIVGMTMKIAGRTMKIVLPTIFQTLNK